MKAIILAAGFGTRLYPMTENTPKALLQLGNKTILDSLVEKLEIVRGVDEIIIVTNGRFYFDFYKWRKRSNYQKNIHIVENKAFVPEKKLGAVRDLELGLRSGYCGSDDFLVFCGGNYFDFPLSHFLLPCLSHPEHAFVGVYDVADPLVASVCGVVKRNEHNLITQFEEKPEDSGTWINGGFFILQPEIAKYLADENLDHVMWERQPMYDLAADQQIVGFRHRGFWKCMDTMRDKEELEKLWEQNPIWKKW